MKNKSLILFFASRLLFFFMIFLPCQSFSDSLKDFIKTTLSNSESLRASQYMLKSSEEYRYKLSSGLMPEISIRSGPFAFEIDSKSPPSMQNQSVLEISQTIFDSGRTFSSSQIGTAEYNRSKSQHKINESEIILNAVNVYTNLLFASEDHKLKKKIMQSLEKHLQAIKIRKSLGESTQSDLANAEARWHASVADTIKSESNLSTAKINFLSLSGMEPDLNKITTPKKLPIVPKSLKEALNEAMTYNSKIISSFYQNQSALATSRLALANTLPSLSVKYTTHLDDTSKNAFGGYLYFPIFNKGQNLSEIRKSYFDSKQALHNHQHTVKNVETAITTEWNNLISSNAFVHSTHQAAISAEMALHTTEKEFEMSIATTLAVIDAQNNLLKAQTANLEAKISHIRAVYSLLLEIGNIKMLSDCLDIEKISQDSLKSNLNQKTNKTFLGSRS